jgi:hypothetical protein
VACVEGLGTWWYWWLFEPQKPARPAILFMVRSAKRQEMQDMLDLNPIFTSVPLRVLLFVFIKMPCIKRVSIPVQE